MGCLVGEWRCCTLRLTPTPSTCEVWLVRDMCEPVDSMDGFRLMRPLAWLIGPTLSCATLALLPCAAPCMWPGTLESEGRPD